jgi:hypothetical protein
MMALYDVISPDGFSIDRVKLYKSEEEAKKAIKDFVKRYEHQGYYSSNRGRIPLDELPERCKIVPAKGFDEEL